MTSVCRMLCRNLNTSLSKIISTKLPTSSMIFIRHYVHDEQHDITTSKQGAFAEFYEKTKESKQDAVDDQDFEVLLRNSNLINVTCKNV